MSAAGAGLTISILRGNERQASPGSRSVTVRWLDANDKPRLQRMRQEYKRSKCEVVVPPEDLRNARPGDTHTAGEFRLVYLELLHARGDRI